jgi:hypothetical protein
MPSTAYSCCPQHLLLLHRLQLYFLLPAAFAASRSALSLSFSLSPSFSTEIRTDQTGSSSSIPNHHTPSLVSAAAAAAQDVLKVKLRRVHMLLPATLMMVAGEKKEEE